MIRPQTDQKNIPVWVKVIEMLEGIYGMEIVNVLREREEMPIILMRYTREEIENIIKMVV